jgi:hypothetical protein
MAGPSNATVSTAVESRIFIRVHLRPSAVPFFVELAEFNEGG